MYNLPPPIISQAYKGNAILAIVIVLAVIASMLGLSIAKATQVSMSSTNSNAITTQAQQYCVGKLELLRNQGYKNISSQRKQVVAGNYSDQVILGDEVEVNGAKRKQVTVQCYYKEESLPRASYSSFISAQEESGSSGSWVDNFPNSGIAPADGIIVATSYLNTYMTIYTSNKERTSVSKRDKYGQGHTSATCPVSKGESYKITGGSAKFFRLN